MRKSKENKEKNDKERFNYDKQYESYFAVRRSCASMAAAVVGVFWLFIVLISIFLARQIERGTSSWVPGDQATRDKLGYSRCAPSVMWLTPKQISPSSRAKYAYALPPCCALVPLSGPSSATSASSRRATSARRSTASRRRRRSDRQAYTAEAADPRFESSRT